MLRKLKSSGYTAYSPMMFHEHLDEKLVLTAEEENILRLDQMIIIGVSGEMATTLLPLSTAQKTQLYSVEFPLE